ncbi:MAG: DNA gyrase subunit A [Rhodospirillaceae bacterium]|nr:DNA gyrase subunit A [Rhodospirillaceae bacterium]MBT6307246.1 DNA gyrase subunit A [Rhodospirillaceae bacterium]MBT7733189.1 DNA gyrase subunit A [Rhodospirillaceae bacterium]
MQRSYLDYAMSVIVSRALPDVRDGLKPVHRRILYAMREGGYDWSKPYRKSARIVGDVMGQYHPHGDSPIYDSMVRMAQEFSLRLPLIDGQGNFGSMDGDPPAAHRYTEARLARSAEGLLRDIDSETVDFLPNYDETTEEPSVLPAEFPNLLVNGAGGIAVGMATNIPPHNLGEVVDACLAYIQNPEITVDELIGIVPGPDFPTGGIVLGKNGIREAYQSGRGSIIMRAKAEIEEIRKDRFAIVVTEIPYQVNKSRLLERIGEVVRDKIVEGISDLRDESDRDGVRVVIELKRDSVGDVVLSQLYRHTALQTSFGANMLALNQGRPEQLNLKDILVAFVAFREQVITRRTNFLLRKARDRAHVLAGLLVALNNIEDIIILIRAAADASAARRALMDTAWNAEDVSDFIAIIDDPGHKVIDGKYILSEAQARAILELRLQRLTGMERGKLVEETKELSGKISDYLEILQSRERLTNVITEELVFAKNTFATPRRTALEESEFEHDIEDLIQREDMVITVSLKGYIKRVPLSTYKAQHRGGKGRSGMATRDEDVVDKLFVANTHTPVLFFTSKGMVYQMKVYRLPLGTPQARGKAMVNLLPLQDGEWIQTVMPMPVDEDTWEELQVMFATSAGTVRRNDLSDFTNIKKNGKIAMKLAAGERLISVQPCSDDHDVLLTTKLGKAIRFQVPDVRIFKSRGSMGVRGIKLASMDSVVGMSILRHVNYEEVPGSELHERDVYLRQTSYLRRVTNDNIDGEIDQPNVMLSPERLAFLGAAEDFILTVTENGIGKRTSAYEYRITNRGGQGIWNMDVTDKAGLVVAGFPVNHSDQIMLVTDSGQLIRCAVEEIGITGRRTKGVWIFRVDEIEKVVSVSLIGDEVNSSDDQNEKENVGT